MNEAHGTDGNGPGMVARAFKFALLILVLLIGSVGTVAYLGESDETLPFNYEGFD